MCAPQGREGRPWQLLMAEEVRLELMGHQESPSRAMARCKWCQEIILIAMCGTVVEACGSYHRRPRKGPAWGWGAAMFHLTSTHSHSPSNPLSPSPAHTSAQFLWLCLHPPPTHQCHNFGKEGWEAARVSEGSDQRGTWTKMGQATWNKGRARTREMLFVIWGRRNGLSRGMSRGGYAWATVPLPAPARQ